ncbi:MAG: 50S ribosomal protein L25 [Pseudomonadales bacterium]|jgi:large subunit ribosomal protein L25|uniref:Large ribosomal subunit protein bL25 n=1 Tax=Halopseudomonas pachastrellae TaxID=254161 RepID=A0A1S8DJE5_9GAMM|nr:50S ribosomal protein L25/general stress protein Ctc [Halopseudomonas pachastrellae]MAB41035.1 50S ribosomal protein L25 [Pseudomonadales bacterium]MAP29244.1 50S ribosomal protein L25 [Pseudomonas sp.]MEE3157255.1 50S ribosomal protein L25/general stress protein Ctc [Pseudomonadota bacterium]MAQ50353.1 50S ribosomal protein L25 [Pseudomonas sp.]MBB52299.1 50S ribosomal protein L25 [Pseudomonadales bacterium]|tara:strand:+ start:1180 stop:1812 length:633 start_codon:yes stop_codon:yes gene_type:complete
MVDFSLNANARNDLGKGASRRLRRNADLVPAIVYGGDKAPQNIALEARELKKALENEAFYSHVIKLSIDGKKEDVLLKALQRHPAKPVIMHADFLRVVAGHEVTVHVPLHFINEDSCVGVKKSGGVISHTMTEVEVNCLPKDLPEFIEVDMAGVDLNQIVHLSDLKLPKGVSIPFLAQGPDHDLPVANVHAARVAAADDAPAAEGEESAE